MILGKMIVVVCLKKDNKISISKYKKQNLYYQINDLDI